MTNPIKEGNFISGGVAPAPSIAKPSIIAHGQGLKPHSTKDKSLMETVTFNSADILGGVRNEFGDYLYIETLGTDVIFKIRDSKSNEAVFKISQKQLLLTKENIEKELKKCSDHVQKVGASPITLLNG